MVSSYIDRFNYYDFNCYSKDNFSWEEKEMQLIRLVLINIKRQLKNPFMVVMTAIAPIFIIMSIYGMVFTNTDDNEVRGNIGVIDKSNSEYSSNIIAKLNEKYSVDILNGEVSDNINLIRDNKLGGIYVIEKDFKEMLEEGSVPKIKFYVKEKTNGTIMSENIITDYINSILQEDISKGLSTNAIETIIKENDITDKSEYRMIISMLCYFMMIGGSIITEEIINLKDQNVLKRAVSTGNSDRIILGSLFLSTFIIQGLLSSIAFSILIFLLRISNYNVIQGIFVIFLGSLITTSIILAVTRWIKNKTLASLFLVIFGLISFGIGIVSSQMESLENVPIMLTRISAFSPFTWLIKILDTGEIIMPSFIIILMAIVFFTAGSFRLREFVKN